MNKSNNLATRKLDIRYIKAYDFKVSPVTGVWGGVATNGQVNINFFHERAVIPDSTTLEVDELTGKPVSPSLDSKVGDVMREFQSGVVMDIATAERMIVWLQDRISKYNAQINPK